MRKAQELNDRIEYLTGKRLNILYAKRKSFTIEADTSLHSRDMIFLTRLINDHKLFSRIEYNGHNKIAIIY